MSQITFIDKNKRISNAMDGVSVISSQAFQNNKAYYLRNMHLKGLWLKCDCVQGDAISFVRDNGTTYSLVNKGSEGKHSQLCPLWTLVNQGAGEPSPPTKGTKINKFNPVPIAHGVSEGGTGKNAGTGENKPRQHRIHTLLCCLLAGDKTKGGTLTLNQYHDNKAYNLQSVYYSQVASATVSNNIKVKDLLFTPPGNTYSPTRDKVEKKAGQFDDKTAPQFYTIIVIDDLDYAPETNTSNLHIDDQVTPATFNKTTHSYPRTSGPRICFIVQAFIDSEWVNQIIYTHPIISKDIPILVDSDLERVVFREIKSALPAGASITKPYFCDDYFDRKLKPDFIVSNGARNNDERVSVVIEVMGLVQDEEYMQRKQELVPLMRKRYKSDVVEVLPYTIEESVQLAIQTIS